jgi:sigma-B regulation protein RsbU (phosphoserine phosphatase)
MPTPEIVIRAPDGGVKTVAIDRPKITLGRSLKESEICYPDDHGLSRRHLAIERQGGSLIIHDLDSKNGTTVNGIRIKSPTKIEPGDRVVAGHLVITFAESASSASNETVVFTDSPADSPSSSTVITSLEGLLERPASIDSAAAANEFLHAQALAIASRELAVDRPLADLFPVIMDQSIQAVGASRGVLMCLENGQLVVKESRGEGFRISTHVRDRVLQSRQSLLVKDTELEGFSENASIVEQNVRSFIAAPLQTKDKVIGLIYLDSSLVREFTKRDLNLITVMASIAAIRIENARLAEVEREEQLIQKELAQAAVIQQGLLPSAPPVVPGLELAGYNAACRTVGGDYYDFFVRPDGSVAVVVADVAGKGMPAAMLMSSLQARIQVLAEEDLELAHLVARLNRTVSAKCPANRFITLFMAVIDPSSGAVTYCNAGHNPPILVRANGGGETLAGGGLILGILPQAQYESHSTNLAPGDTLVLFSDGVTEAAPLGADEEFGEDRLGRLVAANRSLALDALIRKINEEVLAFTRGAPPADDVTLLLARRR